MYIGNYVPILLLIKFVISLNFKPLFLLAYLTLVAIANYSKTSRILQRSAELSIPKQDELFLDIALQAITGSLNSLLFPRLDH